MKKGEHTFASYIHFTEVQTVESSFIYTMRGYSPAFGADLGAVSQKELLSLCSQTILLTKREYRFYLLLKEVADEYHYIICPKVGVKDLLSVTDKNST